MTVYGRYIEDRSLGTSNSPGWVWQLRSPSQLAPCLPRWLSCCCGSPRGFRRLASVAVMNHRGSRSPSSPSDSPRSSREVRSRSPPDLASASGCQGPGGQAKKGRNQEPKTEVWWWNSWKALAADDAIKVISSSKWPQDHLTTQSSVVFSCNVCCLLTEFLL